jgi:hypothetical protein
MNKKILITIIIVIILGIMGYVLFQVAYDEYQNQTSAPNPLPDVVIEDTVKPEESQTITTPSTKFNVADDFRIAQPVYSRLPMYDFNPTNNFSEEYANNLPAKMGLNILSTTTDSEYGKVIISGNGTKSLVIYPDKGELTYSDTEAQTDPTNSNFNTTPKIDIYIESAEDFIKSLGLPESTFQYNSYAYVRGTTDHVEVTESGRDADMIQLKYQATVEDLSIIDKEASLIPNTITVWMNSKADVAKLYYEASGTVGNKFGNYELLTAEDIKKDLQTENTKAKLINGTYPIGEPIESVNITSAHLAYLSVENYLVPVYILEANVRVTGDDHGIGYLLLDAIKK